MVATPPAVGEGWSTIVTEEAGIAAPPGHDLRVTLLADEGAVVAEGEPVACLRDAPDICLVAPMPARVARIALRSGRRLGEIVLFREAGGDVAGFDTGRASEEYGLRTLIQSAGLWPALRRRPFGGMPAGGERPIAIVVMATDTRPLAPDPRRAVEGKEEELARGLDALAILTDGPVLICRQKGDPLTGPGAGRGRAREIVCGPRHPQGAAGLRIHELAPATIESPVWDCHVEDVAALGALLATGRAQMRRHVHVAGPALRESRSVLTQPGADLRGLTYRVAAPGPHVLLSGSALDGREARWLGFRDRQVTALPRAARAGPPHWLIAALTRSARPRPIIPTAALTQAFGGALPAAAFVRALSAGDDETAMSLGVLSLLEEDVALADYVLGGDAQLGRLLRGMLDRIETELAA
ncbi:Na(+)-translocating NADH-quinone reductase subunit A [Wenxinia marina]|uniref:Na(+)-translocating NADH-quinone reductase subunit A n=1 Tax=Wenxinia marina TaxID=390641 RepID=UPI0012F9C38D|nr:Na(+)-translocating NADH-quinone reductase subunit A [Wenxinia marina]